MKSILSLLIVAIVSVPSLRASTLPGFRVERLGPTLGFADSVAIDSHGVIYYTTTAGDLFRFTEGRSIGIAHVTTRAVGDSGLLGMALLDDSTAVVHYTTPGQSYDVISKINLVTGGESVIKQFVNDISFPGRETPPEHHGGNPTVASDGSIFFGIGDYGGGLIASLPEWNGGKIWRLDPDGHFEQFARGFRNPFDMAWDGPGNRLIVCDNGPAVDDEINIVTASGLFYGWPFTMGKQPPVPGAIPPIYVFPRIVAPTGMIALNGANSILKSGFLIGAFVTKAIYFVPDIDASPLPDPIPLIQKETSFVIDVAQSVSGEIFFVTSSAVYKLVVPMRGDCNGDGRIDAADLTALLLELRDGDPQRMTDAQNGSYAGSWGCDANGDGLISSSDAEAIARLAGIRPRPARHR